MSCIVWLCLGWLIDRLHLSLYLTVCVCVCQNAMFCLHIKTWHIKVFTNSISVSAYDWLFLCVKWNLNMKKCDVTCELDIFTRDWGFFSLLILNISPCESHTFKSVSTCGTITTTTDLFSQQPFWHQPVGYQWYWYRFCSFQVRQSQGAAVVQVGSLESLRYTKWNGTFIN